MNYIIIGNGVAGVEAAVAIRKKDEIGKITVLAQSSNKFYYRPRLIDYLSGEVALEKIIAKKDSFYEENNIDIKLGVKVEKIDNESKKIYTNNETFSYDKLLIATGARTSVPKIKGLEKSGIFKLRGIKDADDIKKYCKKEYKIIVIGGGLLGIETANSLLDYVSSVTIVEYYDRLLPKQLDEEGAKVLQKILEKKGLNFKLGLYCEEIIGEKKTEKIQLNNKEILEADMIILSTGVKPRLDLIEGTNIKINKGIIVNDKMETNIEGVYAAGDVAEHNGICYGLWIPAKEQGEMAGLNMTGKEELYKGTPLEARLKVMGVSLFSAGDFNKKSEDVRIEKNESVYKKIVIEKEKLIGAIVIGDNKATITASKVFGGKAELKELFL